MEVSLLSSGGPEPSFKNAPESPCENADTAIAPKISMPVRVPTTLEVDGTPLLFI
jgi:hypothetical protein